MVVSRTVPLMSRRGCQSRVLYLDRRVFHRACKIQHRNAGRRERIAGLQAFKQGKRKRSLQISYAARHGRLADAKRTTGSQSASRVRNGDEVAEIIPIEHDRFLRALRRE
jgi:hypothetical protein